MLGQFFQIQDDYLGYGDPAVIGKIGTDIMDNKCGWLVVQALKNARRTSAIIEANSGKKDPECEKRVTALYVELDMEAVYKKYEEEAYLELRAVIESKDNTLPPELFGAMLKKIYKRSK